MARKFIKRVENFSCDQCGKLVSGNGYTNHCPNCLWSKHVDVSPGDREEDCHGPMKPVGLETRKGELRLKHRCLSCGKISYCKTATHDSPTALQKLAQTIAKQAMV